MSDTAALHLTLQHEILHKAQHKQGKASFLTQKKSPMVCMAENLLIEAEARAQQIALEHKYYPDKKGEICGSSSRDKYLSFYQNRYQAMISVPEEKRKEQASLLAQGDYMRHLILSNHPKDSLEAAWKKCYFNQGKRQINTFVTHDLLNDENPEIDLFSSENITNDYNRLAELYAPYGITVGDIQKIAEKDTYMTAMTQILGEFHFSDDKARNAVDFYQNVENRYIDLLKKRSDKSAVSLQNRNQSER